MKTGRELDALVSEKVMGVTVDFADWACGMTPDCGDYEAALNRRNAEGYDWYSDKGPVNLSVSGFAEPIPFYSRDIAAAMDVQAKMEERGFWMRLQSPWIPGDDASECSLWHAGFTERGITGWNGRPDYQVAASTAPEAICLAALEVIESNVLPKT